MRAPQIGCPHLTSLSLRAQHTDKESPSELQNALSSLQATLSDMEWVLLALCDTQAHIRPSQSLDGAPAT